MEHSTARKILCRLLMHFTTLDQQDYMQYIGVVNHASICYMVKMWNEGHFWELQDDAQHFIKQIENRNHEMVKTNRLTA